MDFEERARRVYLDTGTKFQRPIIWSMGLIKYAAAYANAELGLLPRRLAAAIMGASLEVMEGLHDAEVYVDVFQTGSGTGLNMNINDVIARRASEIAGSRVHPNDHVNMGQSSNDVVPSAVRIAAIKTAEDELMPALSALIGRLSEKSAEFSKVVKPGRTHLRDALPVTLGQELGAYADALAHGCRELRDVLAYVGEIPLGGTAVGTGFGTHPRFRRLAIDAINKTSGLRLSEGNTFRGMRLLTDVLYLSAALRNIAVELMRLAQDVRLMFSGPTAGLAEIDLPSQAEVPGSSMMPGKINPVTAEAVMLAAAQIVGLDHANQAAAGLGEFELAMGIPLIGYNVVAQINLLSEASGKLSELVIADMKPRRDRLRDLAERSPALATALAPALGYEGVSQIVRKISEGKSIRVALEEVGRPDLAQGIPEVDNMAQAPEAERQIDCDSYK